MTVTLWIVVPKLVFAPKNLARGSPTWISLLVIFVKPKFLTTFYRWIHSAIGLKLETIFVGSLVECIHLILSDVQGYYTSPSPGCVVCVQVFQGLFIEGADDIRQRLSQYQVYMVPNGGAGFPMLISSILWSGGCSGCVGPFIPQGYTWIIHKELLCTVMQTTWNIVHRRIYYVRNFLPTLIPRIQDVTPFKKIMCFSMWMPYQSYLNILCYTEEIPIESFTPW